MSHAAFAGAVLGTVATGGRSTELGMTMGLVIGAQGGVCAAVESARRTGALDDATAVRVLAEAVRRVRFHAVSGECVLLAPACASFDQFDGYAHRGQVFAELAGREVAPCP